MDNRFDISNFINVTTEQSIIFILIDRVKRRQKESKLSQKDLAIKSEVSYSSIRRFEKSGEISLISLIKITNVFNALECFNQLLKHKIITNLKDLDI